MTRPLALAGILALGALSLTGCLKVDADVALNPDATGTGTFTFGLQKQAASVLGISSLEDFAGQVTQGDLTEGTGLGVFDTCATSESDTDYLYTCTFTDAAFTDPQGGPWSITRDGDVLTFRMVSDTQQAQDAATEGQDLLNGADLGSVNVDVTFPGPITAVAGSGVKQTSETTATVSGSLTDTIDVTITGQADSGSFGLSALLVVLLAFAVVALVAVVAVVVIMRRRSHAGTSPEEPTDSPADPA